MQLFILMTKYGAGSDVPISHVAYTSSFSFSSLCSPPPSPHPHSALYIEKLIAHLHVAFFNLALLVNVILNYPDNRVVLAVVVMVVVMTE